MTLLADRLGSASAAELVRTLRALREGARAVGGVRGVLLTGSFALGCGDEASDVDVVVVLEGAPTPAQTARARALHRELHALPGRWAGRLEGSWVPASALREPVVADGPWLYLDNGSSELVESSHDDTWHGRWLLRHHGIALSGPRAVDLVPEVDPEALRAEAVRQIDARLASIRGEPAVLLDGWAQPYVVLTVSRALWTARWASVVGKEEAARWVARSEAASRFAGLLDASVRHRVRPHDREGGRADPALARPALEFVEWAASRAGAPRDLP